MNACLRLAGYLVRSDTEGLVVEDRETWVPVPLRGVLNIILVDGGEW